MSHPQARSLGTLALLVAGVAVAWILSAAAWHHAAVSHPRQGRPQDGWRVRGLELRSTDGAGSPIRVSADDVWMRRVRVGPFRLGFAWTLESHDVAVEMRADAAAPDAGAGGGAAATPPAVTSVSIDDLRLRVYRETGEYVDVVAGRGDATWRERRMRLRGGVRVRTEHLDVTVPALDLDTTTRRFVAPRGVDPDVVRHLNTATERVGRPNPALLVRVLSKLTARGVQVAQVAAP